MKSDHVSEIPYRFLLLLLTKCLYSWKMFLRFISATELSLGSCVGVKTVSRLFWWLSYHFHEVFSGKLTPPWRKWSELELKFPSMDKYYMSCQSNFIVSINGIWKFKKVIKGFFLLTLICLFDIFVTKFGVPPS